jgi:hypothetical protein
MVVKDLMYPNPSGVVVKLVQCPNSKVFKEVKFPKPFSIVVKLLHKL